MKRPQGRPPVNHDRPNVVRKLYRGKEQFIAQIRSANAKRTYLRSYDTRQEAEEACRRYLTTGEKPERRNGSPRHVYSPRPTRSATTAPKREKRAPAPKEPQAAPSAKKPLTYEQRMEIIRRAVYRTE